MQPPSTAAKYIPDLNPDVLDLAERYLIQEAQVELKSEELESLLPEKVATKGAGNHNIHIILVGGRARVRYRIGYDKDGIPVLPCKNQLSRLYMTEAHNVDHGGINTTVMRSRAKVWIIQGAKLAKKVVNQCYRCRLNKKKLLNQVMAPLPEERLTPAPVFNSVALDLFGPLEIRDLVKKRVTGKGWGVIFVCMATSAIHLELAESYSTESFLQALRRFICIRGTPSLIQSDRGTQLTAAAKEVCNWDFSEIQEWCATKKLVWNFVPTGAQHQNGQAERFIGVVKKVLNDVFRIGNQVCTYGELNTLLQEAAQIVNSRPLGIQGRVSDTEAGGPITPNHILLGRATAEAPKVITNGPVTTASRLQFLRDLRNQFWNKFKSLVYQGLDRSHKWKHEIRDFQKGDVVLLKQETAASATFRLGLIHDVYPSLSDNKVRRVLVKYKNPGEQGFRYSERHANKLVLIIPREEQSITYELIENKNSGKLEFGLLSELPKEGENRFSDPRPEDEKSTPETPMGGEPDDSDPDADESATDESVRDPEAALGAASTSEHDKKLSDDADMAGDTPHSGGASPGLRHEEPITRPSWAGRLRSVHARERPKRYQ